MNNPNDFVAIVDYKLGNLFSVKHACIHVGINPVVTSEKQIISKAKAIILPGVGAFGDAMKNLEKLDLISLLKDQVQSGVPLLGICLGLQLLFTESEEFGENKGLDLIKGKIVKFPPYCNNGFIKVPQIGWNTIYCKDKNNWNNSALDSIQQNEFMYFVHSYYAKPDNEEEILTLTNYEDLEYCSSILKENIFATQFHPEKSSTSGIEVYQNWAQRIRNIQN